MNKPHIHIPFEMIDEYLELALKHEINMEVFFTGSTLDSIKMEDAARFRDMLPYGPSISVHGPFMDLSPGAIDSKIRHVTMERFDQTIELAGIIKAECVVFHSGYEKWKYALDTNLWLEKSLETWIPINKKAEGIGVRIAIENIFEDEPSNLKMLMEAMSSKNFGVCFDTGHFNIFSNTPLDLWVDTLSPYIIELHVHDNDRTFDQHLPIGAGSFEFERFFALIKDLDIIITLENHSPQDIFKSISSLAGFNAVG